MAYISSKSHYRREQKRTKQNKFKEPCINNKYGPINGQQA